MSTMFMKFCLASFSLSFLVSKAKSEFYFNYDPFSAYGPLNWGNLDTADNEFKKYSGTDRIDYRHDLNVAKNKCDDEHFQSPRNLIANERCRDNHDIVTRKIRDTDCKFDSLTFSIRPQLLQATLPLNDVHCVRPTIDLANGLPNWWILAWIEVHIRAEHLVDGRRYDGELMMYHLGLEDQKRQVAIVSVLLDASSIRDEPQIQPLIDKWQEVADQMKVQCQDRRMRRRAKQLDEFSRFLDVNEKAPGKDHKNYFDDGPMSRDDVQFDPWSHYFENSDAHFYHRYQRSLQDGLNQTLFDDFYNGTFYNETFYNGTQIPRNYMFPYNLWPSIWYYRYRASLTRPPCSTIAHHRVIDEPLKISRKQWKQLGKLLNSYIDPHSCKTSLATSPTGENYRNLQKIGTEKEFRINVTHCTDKNFIAKLYDPDDA